MNTTTKHVAIAIASCGVTIAFASAQTARFSRPTDSIRIFGETILGDAYTIEAMVLREAGPASEGRIFGEQLNGQEDKTLRATPTSTGGGVWNNACDASGAGSSAIPTGVWTHVVFMRGAGAYRLFVDGVPVAQNPATCASRNAVGSVMNVGALQYTLSTFVDTAFLGYVDWLRVSTGARYNPAGFAPTVCEPAVDATTQVLLLCNDAPGTMTPQVSGSGVVAAAVAYGFSSATSPTFGPAPIAPASCCDSIDFNRDTLTPDSGDLDDFINVLAGGPAACSTFPTPGCNDIDFNNDGFSPDSLDLDSFLSRLAGGPCL